MEVEVVRSSKRRKSVSARIVDGRIVIRMPQWMTKAQEREYVESLVAKLVRQHTAKAVDLPARARELARRYDLPEPTTIRFVSNQASPLGLVHAVHRRHPHHRPHRRLPRLGARRRDRPRARPPRGARPRPRVPGPRRPLPQAGAGLRLPPRHAAHRRRGRASSLVGVRLGQPVEPRVHALVDLLERPLDGEQLPLDPLQRTQIRLGLSDRGSSIAATLGGGGGGQGRTVALRIKNPLLCQLSYTPDDGQDNDANEARLHGRHPSPRAANAVALNQPASVACRRRWQFAHRTSHFAISSAITSHRTCQCSIFAIREHLVDAMVELEHDRIRLAAVDAWMVEQVLECTTLVLTCRPCGSTRRCVRRQCSVFSAWKRLAPPMLQGLHRAWSPSLRAPLPMEVSK